MAQVTAPFLDSTTQTTPAFNLFNSAPGEEFARESAPVPERKKSLLRLTPSSDSDVGRDAAAI